MTREELKSLLLNNPNEFWDLIGREGLTEYLISILDEADSECSGEGMEESPLMSLQIFEEWE